MTTDPIAPFPADAAQTLYDDFKRSRELARQNNGAWIESAPSIRAALRFDEHDFKGVIAVNCDLSRLIMRDRDFEGANLSSSNLTGSDLSNAIFTDASLDYVRAQGSLLIGTRLNHANIDGADLSRATLTSASMDKVVARRATFTNARFRYVRITGGEFRYCDFRDAYMSSAEIADCDLTYSSLRNADLSYAALRKCDLDGVDFTGAILKETIIYCCSLHSTKGIYSVYVPELSSRGDYLYGVDHGDKLMLKAGCWWGDYEEFVSRVTGYKGADHPYHAAAQFILDMWQRKADF